MNGGRYDGFFRMDAMFKTFGMIVFSTLIVAGCSSDGDGEGWGLDAGGVDSGGEPSGNMCGRQGFSEDDIGGTPPTGDICLDDDCSAFGSNVEGPRACSNSIECDPGPCPPLDVLCPPCVSCSDNTIRSMNDYAECLITVPSRLLRYFHAGGLSRPATHCGESEQPWVMRMVFLDADSTTIRPNRWISNSSIEFHAQENGDLLIEGLSESLGAQDFPAEAVELADAGLYEARPEASSSELGCTDDVECGGDGFLCREGAQDESPGTCQLDVPLQSRGARFVSDSDAHLFAGLVIEESGSLAGFRPPSEGYGAYDRDDDGVAEEPVTDAASEEAASDRAMRRRSAANSAFGVWESVRGELAREPRKAHFGVWTFGGDSGLETHVDSGWGEDPDLVRDGVAEYLNSEPPRGVSRANVYESAVDIIENNYTDAAVEAQLGGASKVERVLTLVVDGPDELGASSQASIDDLIDAATEADVRLFVVHLDAARELGELRDDPLYHTDQTPDACDCKNYETCRTPRGYASAVDEATENLADRSTFCMPDFDSKNGRLGPIDDYSRLACATGGSYAYITDPVQLVDSVSWTPAAGVGLWEATFDPSYGAAWSGFETGRAFSIGGELRVELGGDSHTKRFSPMIEGSPHSDDRQDNRPVIFTDR